MGSVPSSEVSGRDARVSRYTLLNRSSTSGGSESHNLVAILEFGPLRRSGAWRDKNLENSIASRLPTVYGFAINDELIIRATVIIPVGVGPRAPA